MPLPETPHTQAPVSLRSRVWSALDSVLFGIVLRLPCAFQQVIEQFQEPGKVEKGVTSGVELTNIEMTVFEV